MPRETLSLRAVVTKHFDRLTSSYDQKARNRANYLSSIDAIVLECVTDDGLVNPAILDAGTGTGTRLESLKQRIPGSKVFAIDVSRSMLQRANERNLNGTALADMSALPFRENSFDYIFCFFNALGYVPTEIRRIAALKEFYRVLAPTGALFIDVLNRWHTGEGLSFKKSKRQISRELAISRESSELEEGDVLFSLQVNSDTIPGYFHSFTKRSLDKQFGQAGFVIEDFQVIGYDSGLVHDEIQKGNFLYTLRKACA